MINAFNSKEKLRKTGYYVPLLLDNAQQIGKLFFQNNFNKIIKKIADNI
jgi:hypothetical protein